MHRQRATALYYFQLGFAPYLLSPSWLLRQSRTRSHIAPTIGIRVIKNQKPLLPVSCRRLTSTANDGMSVTSHEKRFTTGIMPNRNVKSHHHQYSLLLARPLNVAYFLKHAAIAPPNESTGSEAEEALPKEHPHFTHTTASGFEGAPQVGQKRFPVPAFTPHLTQTTALSLISLPQFLQYIMKLFTIPAPQYGVKKTGMVPTIPQTGLMLSFKIQSIHPLYSRTIPTRETRQHIAAEQRVLRKFMIFFFSLHIFCKKIEHFFSTDVPGYRLHMNRTANLGKYPEPIHSSAETDCTA